MRLRLGGRDTTFFALLLQQAEAVHGGAQALQALVADFGSDAAAARHAAGLRAIERRGDEIERAVVGRLQRAHRPPLERSDIYAITNKLEAILDILEGVADRIELYAVEALTPEVLAIADQITVETAALVDVVGSLASAQLPRVAEAAQALRAIENDIDKLYREGVARLFKTPGLPPLEVFKLKEILEALEEASDHCEDVASLVEGITVKHV